MNFIIKLKEGQQSFAKYLKTTDRTVRDALLGKTNSSFAKMIRRIAIEHGANVYAKVPAEVYLKDQLPDFETDFDQSAKLWTMKFSDRVQVVADLSNGTTVITVDSEVRSTYENVTIKQLPGIQMEAQVVADKLNLNNN